MSHATKAAKRNRAQREARQRRRERTWAACRRHRPQVLKRPPKWLRCLAKRDPEFRGMTCRQIATGVMFADPAAKGGGR